jgi:hypothetical protein
VANPPRSKGTSGEREVLRLLLPHMPGLVRNPSSALVDLSAPGNGFPLQVLATRPDRGRWLFTLGFEDFAALWDAGPGDGAVDIEVKRLARVALHGIYEQKFPRR